MAFWNRVSEISLHVMAGSGIHSFSCTALQGVPMGAVICTAGRCVSVACDDGSILIDGDCHRL